MLRGSVLDCSLHSVHEEEKPFELEICWISDATSRVFQRVPEDTLQAAEQAAKASLEESDMCASPLQALLLVAGCTERVVQGDPMLSSRQQSAVCCSLAASAMPVRSFPGVPQPPWYIICCVRADGLYGGGAAGRTDKALAWGLL